MGQRLASFREFFRMDGNKQHTSETCNTDSNEHADVVFDMLGHNDDIENNLTDNENNGNQPVQNLIGSNDENKQSRNVNNEQMSLDNHNSRFESIYSQPLDVQQESKQVCSNGNFVGGSETDFKQQEPCCSSSGSNSSSSSEDSPINPTLRRTSKTLSFGKRKSKFIFFIFLFFFLFKKRFI